MTLRKGVGGSHASASGPSAASGTGLLCFSHKHAHHHHHHNNIMAPMDAGTAYGFVEYASDLGGGRGLEGNPTEYYRKPGRGMSYGAGIKVGAMRAHVCTLPRSLCLTCPW